MSFTNIGGDTGANGFVVVPLAIITSPIWLPALAVFGIYNGAVAIINHGLQPGLKKISAASKKV